MTDTNSTPANPAQGVSEAIDEGLEILVNLIDSITRHGNYTPESTCMFIDQAGAAFRAARANFVQTRASDARLVASAPGTVADEGAAIGAGGQAVQDTWFTDRALPVRAMSGDAEDNRVLRLHFRRPVTDDDRKAMCDALNLHQASLTHPAPSGQAVAWPAEPTMPEAAKTQAPRPAVSGNSFATFRCPEWTRSMGTCCPEGAVRHDCPSLRRALL